MSYRNFHENGFTIVPGVLDDAACDRLMLPVSCHGDPGRRHLLGEAWCADLASRLRLHPEVAALVPADHVAVQCTCFGKSTATNWLVAIHQDLGIPVRSRIDRPELSGWSTKEGILHVQPPVELLRQLVAIRLHLDACGEDDGPLRVVPGSHRLGRIGPDEISAVREDRGVIDCPAPRGSIMAMRPLLLHASSKARGASRRRVLHYLFGPRSLPYGLQWPHAV